MGYHVSNCRVHGWLLKQRISILVCLFTERKFKWQVCLIMQYLDNSTRQRDLEMFLGKSQEQLNDKIMEQRGHKSSTEDKRQAVILRCAQVSHSLTLKLGSLWRLWPRIWPRSNSKGKDSIREKCWRLIFDQSREEDRSLLVPVVDTFPIWAETSARTVLLISI